MDTNSPENISESASQHDYNPEQFRGDVDVLKTKLGTAIEYLDTLNNLAMVKCIIDGKDVVNNAASVKSALSQWKIQLDKAVDENDQFYKLASGFMLTKTDPDQKIFTAEERRAAEERE